VTGKKDGHHFIAQLRITHVSTITFDVLRQQQHRKQITAVDTRPSPFFNQPVDNRIESTLCTVKTSQLR
jgi:hypothetical protein